MVPLRADDYRLAFLMVEENGEGVFTQNRVDSFSELFYSWWVQYNFFCGRLSELLIATIMMLGGKPLFLVLNAAVWITFNCLLCKWWRVKVRVGTIMVCICASLLFFPFVDGTVYQISGACSYLWAATLFLSFMLLLRQFHENNGNLLGLCTVGFLCCSMHAGLAPVCGGLIAFYVLKKCLKEHISSRYLLIIASVALGTLVVMASPSMWNRALDGCEFPIFQTIDNLICYCTVPFIVLTIIWCKKRRVFKSEVGIITLLLLVLTIRFAANGTWGACCFIAVCTMLLMFDAFGDYLFRMTRGVGVYVIGVILVSGSAFQYNKFFKADSLVQKVLHGKSDAYGVKVIDAHEFGGSLPGCLHMAFPQNRGDFLSNFVAPYYGCDEFYVFFRMHLQDRSIYRLFSDNKYRVEIATNGVSYVIRLPENCSLTGPIELENEEAFNKKFCLSSSDINWILKIKDWKDGIERLRYIVDYDDGFYYIILPPELKKNDVLSFKYMDWNNETDGESKKLKQVRVKL